MHTHTRVFNFMYVFFIIIWTTICATGTRLSLSGESALRRRRRRFEGRTWRDCRGHQTRTHTSPTTRPSSCSSSPPLDAAKLRNPRDCYAGGPAGGRSTGCSFGYYYCCYIIILSAADDTRKPRAAQLCLILYIRSLYSRVIIYLYNAHISICVLYRRNYIGSIFFFLRSLHIFSLLICHLYENFPNTIYQIYFYTYLQVGSDL